MESGLLRHLWIGLVILFPKMYDSRQFVKKQEFYNIFCREGGKKQQEVQNFLSQLETRYLSKKH